MPKSLNSNQLKLIAIIAMTIDHLTWTVFPGYDTRWFVILAHVVGRLTAPVMWFFIAEGYHHTRNIKKYIRRLFLLAAISHFAYNFCFGIPFIPFQDSAFNQTSVAWPLAWGLVLLWVNDSHIFRPWQKLALVLLVCLITFPADWSCVAAMAVFFMGTERGNFQKQMGWMMVWTSIYSAVYFLCIDKVYAIIQFGTCLAIPLLKMYNGTRDVHTSIGKFFYTYYPAHLVLCGLLRILI